MCGRCSSIGCLLPLRGPDTFRPWFSNIFSFDRKVSVCAAQEVFNPVSLFEQ